MISHHNDDNNRNLPEVSIRHLEFEDQAKVGMRLLVRKYHITKDRISVKLDDKTIIILPNDYKEVTNTIDSVKDLELVPPEFSKMYSSIDNEASLFNELEQYQRHDFSNQVPKIMFKLYYDTEPSGDIIRRKYGRKWIDFNKQIAERGFVWDSYKQYGLWCVDAETIEPLIASSSARKYYGDSLLIVEPRLNVTYTVCKAHISKNIIGDSYNVIAHGMLGETKTDALLERYIEEAKK